MIISVTSSYTGKLYYMNTDHIKYFYRERDQGRTRIHLIDSDTVDVIEEPEWLAAKFASL